MPKLVFTSSALAHQSYELILERTAVGRGEQNTLVIHDPSLSAAHCEILMHGTEIIVRDLDSRNGTFINGLRLHNSQAELRHGQTVRFGSVEARLELEDPPEDSTASDVTAVHAFGRLIRDQRREERKPRPTNVAQHFGAESPEPPEDKTLMMEQAPLEVKPAASPEAVPSVTRPNPKRETLVWIVISVVVLVIIGVVWRVLSR